MMRVGLGIGSILLMTSALAWVMWSIPGEVGAAPIPFDVEITVSGIQICPDPADTDTADGVNELKHVPLKAKDFVGTVTVDPDNANDLSVLSIAITETARAAFMPSATVTLTGHGFLRSATKVEFFASGVPDPTKPEEYITLKGTASLNQNNGTLRGFISDFQAARSDTCFAFGKLKAQVVP